MPRLRKILPACFAVVAAFSASDPSSLAVTPNVRGRITGQDKIVPDVYAEAARPDAKRWSWREPSPAVAAQFRNLSPLVSREIVLAATNSAQNPAATAPILVRVTGGRTNPATLVVTPDTQIQFRNDDPFPHKLYVVGQPGWNGAMDPKAVREWKAPGGQQRIEFRDEKFPSVRSYVVVDPQVVQTVYPTRENAFAFALPPGDFVVKAFFGGKPVGKPIGVTVKDHGTAEIKDPINVSEGADSK